MEKMRVDFFSFFFSQTAIFHCPAGHYWAAWRSRETLVPLGPSGRGRGAASQGELRSPRDRRAASCHEPVSGL
jgi:hypothetical protein